MIAIVDVSGTQVKMTPEALVRVPKIDAEVGKKIEYDKVLFLQDGENVSVGKPYVEAAKVQATVYAQDKTKKTRASIYKRRKQYKKSWGFREEFTLLKITKVSGK